MKIIYSILLTLCLIAAGCSDNKDDKLSSHEQDKTGSPPAKSVKVSNDTLLGGDTFITTGPAGKMDQKQGKVVMIADSGLAMPIKLQDKTLMAMGLTDSTMYRVKKEGDHTALVLPDSDMVLKDGRMMLLTDDGEMLEVKIIGDQMVVLTNNNTMLPLEKK